MRPEELARCAGSAEDGRAASVRKLYRGTFSSIKAKELTYDPVNRGGPALFGWRQARLSRQSPPEPRNAATATGLDGSPRQASPKKATPSLALRRLRPLRHLERESV